MKKNILFFILIIFTLATVPVYGATATGEEMVMPAAKSAFAGSEPVPPAPVTEEGIAKAILKKLGDIPGKLKNIQGEVIKKDNATAKAIREFETKRDTATATAINGLKTEVSTTATSVKNNDDANMTLIILVIVASLVVVVIVIFLSKIKRKKNKPVTLLEVNDQLSLLNRSIKATIKESQREMEKNIPTATDKLVKKLDPITIDFEVQGHNVSYTPPIKDGAYLTLYVPLVAEEQSDPSKIARLRKDKRGKVYNITLEVMSDFFSGEFDKTGKAKENIRFKMQKELIEYAKSTGELKIA